MTKTLSPLFIFLLFSCGGGGGGSPSKTTPTNGDTSPGDDTPPITPTTFNYNGNYQGFSQRSDGGSINITILGTNISGTFNTVSKSQNPAYSAIYSKPFSSTHDNGYFRKTIINVIKNPNGDSYDYTESVEISGFIKQDGTFNANLNGTSLVKWITIDSVGRQKGIMGIISDNLSGNKYQSITN
jgi:hypothetical protein